MEVYKSEMCTGWELSGYCLYGSNCCFAHGKNELNIHKKGFNYKTRKCINYWKKGCCMYGRRCQFKHDERTSWIYFYMLLLACKFDLSSKSRLKKWLPESKIK